MQNFLCTSTSSAPQLRNRLGSTALAVLMMSLGVGATTALFSIVDGVMPHSTPSVRCETVMRISGEEPAFAIRNFPNGGELRDQVSDAYEMSVASASDALDAIPAAADALGAVGARPALALAAAFAIGFLVLCTRSASRMIAPARAWLVAIGTTTGALLVATLSLRALDLPAIGVRAIAFSLCVSLITIWVARVAQRSGSPLTI